MTQHRFFPYLVLLIGVLVAATSSILIRLAQMEGAPSLVIASWRLTLAVVVLTPLALRRRTGELRQLPFKDISWGIVAGIFLAAHLGIWISSLAFTSVASSAALVSTNPLWVALAVFLFFGERPSRKTVIGLAAALVGSILIAFSDGGVLLFEPTATPALQFSWQNMVAPTGKADTVLWGDTLALFGAIAVSGYLLIGRNLRRRLSTTAYVWLAYTAAAVALLIYTQLAGVSMLSYSWMAFLWIFLLALGPQLLAHTSFNWALAHLSTTFVALAILGEPVGSAIFAYFIFGERFEAVQLIGFVLLLVGIGMGVLGEQQNGE